MDESSLIGVIFGPRWAVFASALAMLPGCGTPDAGAQGDAQCPASNRVTQALFGGAGEEQYLGLGPLEQSAVVWVRFVADDVPEQPPCSGILIHSKFVLTVAHCAYGQRLTGASVRFGPDGSAPVLELAATRAHLHPTHDAAMIELDQAVPNAVAIPIRLSTFEPQLLVGARVSIAGYGLNEERRLGLRSFVSENVASVEAERLIVDGRGASGACSGDSGGPALFFEGGSPVVVGILKGGEDSCLGKDWYTTASALLPWAAALTGDFDGSEAGCGEVTSAGRCFSSPAFEQAVWCTGSERAGERCSAEERCGWDARALGFRCVARADDACAAESALGRCDGSRAISCVEGAIVSEECAPCGVCGIDPVRGRAGCGDSAVVSTEQ